MAVYATSAQHLRDIFCPFGRVK